MVQSMLAHLDAAEFLPRAQLIATFHMYQDFYGLRELPFELTLNPKFLFLTSRHREALSMLEYGLFAPKPVTVLIGEAGMGKTALDQRSTGIGAVPSRQQRPPGEPHAHT